MMLENILENLFLIMKLILVKLWVVVTLLGIAIIGIAGGMKSAALSEE